MTLFQGNCGQSAHCVEKETSGGELCFFLAQRISDIG